VGSPFEIRIEGRLDAQWADWFEGMTLIGHDDGTTVLTGTVIDQAELHGLLARVGALGLTLVSVNSIKESADGRGG
jgi:hypothetical protein